jgi:hypothetical protein
VRPCLRRRSSAVLHSPRSKKPLITAEHIKLARHTVRLVTRLRAVRKDELAAILGCDQQEARTAAVVAVQWRRVARRNGFLVPASRDRERRTA